jgi:hypothetical protein
MRVRDFLPRYCEVVGLGTLTSRDEAYPSGAGLLKRASEA